MMKKPTSKKMMPAKKAMMGSKMASAPMMKKGGSVKKYEMGGASGPPRKKNDIYIFGSRVPEGGPIEGRTSYTLGSNFHNPGSVKFSKPAGRPAPAKPTVTPPNRKNSPLRDGTYRKGGKSTMMRKGGKSMKGC